VGEKTRYLELASIGIILLLAVAITGAAQPGAFETYGNKTVLTVAGDGSVSVDPDVTMLSITVKTAKDNATEAAIENSRRMNEVIAALESEGLSKDSMKIGYYGATSSSSGYFETCRGNVCEKRVFDTSNETVSQMLVRLESTDPARIEKIIGDARSAGADEAVISGYSLKDPKPAQAKAREVAYKNARDEAQSMAEMLGFKLGKVLQMYTYPDQEMEDIWSYGSAQVQRNVEVSTTVVATFEVVD
jgi:uncharacterized protein